MSTATLEVAVPLQELERRDEEPQFEIIDGQAVEMPPMSAYAVRIANRLSCKINEFSSPRNLGESLVEVLFHLHLPEDRNRRPNVAFVSYQRWPKDRPMPMRGNAWDVVPDLAVEVISPTELAYEVMDKIDEYFRSGVRLVWVIYPETRVAQVFESLTSVKMVTEAEALDGGSVLPGFRQPLAELFPPAAANGVVQP